MKIEESFQKIEKIITELEDKDTPLDQAFQKYQEGINLINECNTSLDKVEKQIIVLNEQQGEEEGK